jgi:hypothetical protein
MGKMRTIILKTKTMENPQAMPCSRRYRWFRVCNRRLMPYSPHGKISEKPLNQSVFSELFTANRNIYFLLVICAFRRCIIARPITPPVNLRGGRRSS